MVNVVQTKITLHFHLGNLACLPDSFGSFCIKGLSQTGVESYLDPPSFNTMKIHPSLLVFAALVACLVGFAAATKEEDIDNLVKTPMKKFNGALTNHKIYL